MLHGGRGLGLRSVAPPVFWRFSAGASTGGAAGGRFSCSGGGGRAAARRLAWELLLFLGPSLSTLPSASSSSPITSGVARTAQPSDESEGCGSSLRFAMCVTAKSELAAPLLSTVEETSTLVMAEATWRASVRVPMSCVT